jgi:hypothetical protein
MLSNHIPSIAPGKRLPPGKRRGGLYNAAKIV